jgi:hypothetical protein
MSTEMPADLRAGLIELLAEALVADVQKHPELYFAGNPKVPDPTDETGRGLARNQVVPRSPALRGRRLAPVEAAQKAPGSHA